MLIFLQPPTKVCAEPVPPQPLGWTYAVHVLALALFLCLWSLPSQAARLALLIGNDSYRSVGPLVNARNDARLMAQTLQRAGFDTTLVSDLDRTRFWAAIDSFKGRVQKGDEIVFYFAGHGVQIGANQLLLPVDIIRQNERQVERDGVSLVEVQDALKDARFAMFVIDACRDNPFPKIGGRSVGGERGLLPPEPATGQVIVMAAGRNQAALDRVPDNAANNGLFTYELAQALQQPGVDVRALLETVKERVDDKAKLVGHEQRPSFVNDLRGNFYFFGPTTAQVAPPAPAAPAALAAPAAVSAEQEERVFWEDAKAAGNQEAYEAYLENYPKGRYTSLARANLARLNAAKAAAQKLVTDAVAERANKAEQDRRAAEEVQKAAQRAASERLAAEAAVKEQQRLAMEAQAKEQARLAALPKPGQVIKDCSDCPEMVVIPADSFTMGSSAARIAANFSAAQNNEVKTVVSDGIGRNAGEAAQNAAQNALKNVVGSFIDSKTELEKRVQIQNGVKLQSQNIKTDIKEYSQGVIKSFQILKVSNSDGFVKVTAEVTVKIDDLKIYIKKIAEAQVQVNEGLFAQMKIEEKQNKNAAALIYDRILLPLVKGDGIDFSITAPKPLNQMDLSKFPKINLLNYGLEEYKEKYPNFSIVGFIVKVKPKVNLYDNALKVLDSIAVSKVDLGVLNSEFSMSSKIQYLADYNYHKDLTLTLMENQPGSKNTDPKSFFTYLIRDAKSEFSKISDWTPCLMSGRCEESMKYYSGKPTPVQTLQLEIIGEDGKPLQRERILGAGYQKWRPLGPKNNRMIVFDNSTLEDYFSSEWSLVGGQYKGGLPIVIVRDSNEFILLVALSDEALKGGKSIVLKLVN